MDRTALRQRHPSTSTTLPPLTPKSIPQEPDVNPYLLSEKITWRSQATWTTLHHETSNIYTHLIPALIFSSLSLVTTLPNLHLASCTICLLLSAAYHANNHRSPYALKADYCGILQLLVVNFGTGLHYAFGDRRWRNGYIVLTILLALPSITLHLHPSLSRREIPTSSKTPQEKIDPNRTLRVTSLIVTGLSALIPIAHLYALRGSAYLVAVGVGWYILEGVVMIVGAVVYLKEIPESWYPDNKVFALWSSHAFWHVLVVLGMVAHSMGLVCAMRVVRE